jgi:hypothetical protein
MENTDLVAWIFTKNESRSRWRKGGGLGGELPWVPSRFRLGFGLARSPSQPIAFKASQPRCGASEGNVRDFV